MGIDRQSARRVFMVLSPQALPYAELALRTLLRNSDEPLDLRLITDAASDKEKIADRVETLAPDARHRWSVIAEDDLADAEASVFARLPALRAFRHGHPCWRKITDPVLLSAGGDELILLDPDLLFPNRFRFEPETAKGVRLMWQQPNCLLPPQVVRTVLEAGIPLARHVDIGVAHWRLSGDLGELEWLDWLIAKLGGSALPRVMHIEAIVWAALAMHAGGSYLDPKTWVCWRRSQTKRIARKLAVPGARLLSREPWTRMKCFHAGGEAKWWVAEAEAAGRIGHGDALLDASADVPYVELTAKRYAKEQAAKSALAGLGYYRLFDAGRT